MAKIPLRAYLKEISNLIEHGEIEQAIAHAKNILRSYPKHIETYRVLGKAFLESQRYSEASDILQRVLSVIPDDFVSQIGMSIIREDEGNLDASIWHMERAYEVQPFNPAVQDELRRLYGRRDGVEPPKIRLTRGALVRMYARGELYAQAIAETRAALAEDPQRLDLRVLLARLYYQAGHKNDSAEVCSELISKLPYCYEANRLLAEILPTTSRAEETPKFQQRIFALDPYAAFISPSAPTSQQVPDQAVMVEQYTWEPGSEIIQAPEWTRTVGVEWEETEEEVLPDWLNTLKPAAPPARTPEGIEKAPPAAQETPLSKAEETAAELMGEDVVPDWMKEAGWTKTDRSADEIMAEQTAPAEAESLQPAEIPDWLQSMAPPEAENQQQEEERTEWLETILTPPAVESAAETTELTTPEVPAQEYSAGTKAPEEPLAPSAENQEATASTEEEVPEWLAQLGEAPEIEPIPGEATSPVEMENLESTPEMGEIVVEPQAAEEGETPDWLKDFASATMQPEPQTDLVPETQLSGWDAAGEPEEEESISTEGLPDWLQTMEAETAQPEAVGGGLPAVGEVPLEISVPEEEQVEEPEPAAGVGETTAAPAAASAAASEEMPDLDDMDAAMAWLESLAARQGADEATLITAPEDRTETPPEWLQKEVQEDEQTRAVSVEEPLESIDETAVEETVPEEIEFEQPVEPIAQAPEQPEMLEQSVSPLDEPAATAELESTAQPSGPDLTDMDAAMAWLESLAARQGADEETLMTPPEQRTETPPDWLQQEIAAEETQEAVSEIVPGDFAPSETEATLSEAEEAATAEIPAQPEAASEMVEAGEVLPDWLKDTAELHTEAVEPQVTSIEEETTAVEFADLDIAGQAAAAQPEAQSTLEEPPVSAEPELQPETSAAPEEPEARGWLSDLELPGDQETGVESAEAVPDWLKELEQETSAAEPSLEGETGQLETPAAPEWIASLEEPQTRLGAAEEGIPEWLAGLEEESETAAIDEQAAPPTSEYRAAWEPETTAETRDESGEEPAGLPVLQAALTRGDVDNALDGYQEYIQRGDSLDVVIRDLREALYRFPVDIAIWQALGDAYARNDQFQDALDAYTKAEELLR